MALVQKRTSRRTTILMISLFAVILIGGAVLLFLQSDSGGDELGDIGTSGSDLPVYTDFRDSVYTTPQFQNLQDLSSEFLEAETSGNPNPFQ